MTLKKCTHCGIEMDEAQIIMRHTAHRTWAEEYCKNCYLNWLNGRILLEVRKC